MFGFSKKGFSLLLCFVLIFALASCGGQNTNDIQTSSTTFQAPESSAPIQNSTSAFEPTTAEAQKKQIKNIILFIGDGMGFNSIEKTKSETGKNLAMDTFKIRAEASTYSFDSTVTDSAAGATALACGIKTNNGAVGVYPNDENAKNSYPLNLSELFHRAGKKTGIITTDSTDGATPAGFSAHTSSRKNANEITADQLKSSLDLIWGKKSESCTSSLIRQNGFAYVSTLNEFEALRPGTKSFAQFVEEIYSSDGLTVPTFSQMTQKAIELLSGGENGFFLMAEGAHIDKNSHENNGERMNEALLSFDEAIAGALDFARLDGQTLVVVTADHETGGITLKDSQYAYTTTTHTGVNVPLFVYGYDDFLKNGETQIDNTEIPKRIASAAGISADSFPMAVKS